MINEKQHRLPNEFYKSDILLSITSCIKDRHNIFTVDSIFHDFEKILIDIMHKYNCCAHIYLFMPDHLHLIFQGESNDVNLLDALKAFKQKTGFYFSVNKFNCKWQKDYYDHIIRDEKDLGNQIMYILLNPVRKGFVKHWKEYSYKGSMIYDLNTVENF